MLACNPLKGTYSLYRPVTKYQQDIPASTYARTLMFVLDLLFVGDVLLPTMGFITILELLSNISQQI